MTAAAVARRLPSIIQTRAGRDDDDRCVVCGEVMPPTVHRIGRAHIVHLWSDGALTHIGCDR